MTDANRRLSSAKAAKKDEVYTQLPDIERELRRSLDWERANPMPDPAVFTCDILPRLVDVTATDLARATGLWAGYCSMIRRGRQIPHPRHWEALRGTGH